MKKDIWVSQIFPLGIFTIFIFIMVYVAYVAFTRESKMPKLDVAKIQQLRYEKELEVNRYK